MKKLDQAALQAVSGGCDTCCPPPAPKPACQPACQPACGGSHCS